MKGGGAMSTFSNIDTALEAEAAQASHGSQIVQLTAKQGEAVWQQASTLGNVSSCAAV